MAGCLPGSGPSGGGSTSSAPGTAVSSGAAGPAGGGAFAASGEGASVGRGESEEPGDGGDAPLGGAPDVVSDTPIVVSGLPIGSTPGPHCAPRGTTLSFDPAKLVVTGRIDELGRREILLKSFLKWHLQTASGPVGDKFVSISNPENSEQRYGSTFTWNGCVFAKVYAPPSSSVQVVRLSASELLCARELPDVNAEGVSENALSRLTLGPTSTTAVLDVTLPVETVETTLEDCGAYDWKQPFWDRALNEQFLNDRIEKAQEENSGDSSATPSWKDSVMQRSR